MLSCVLVYLLSLAPLAGPGTQTIQVVPLPRDGEVLVSFKLDEPLTDDIRAAIQSGMTVKFVYKVDLRRSSAGRFDRMSRAALVTASVKYDTLTRLYLVSRAVDGRMEFAETTGKEDVAWSTLTRD